MDRDPQAFQKLTSALSWPLVRSAATTLVDPLQLKTTFNKMW